MRRVKESIRWRVWWSSRMASNTFYVRCSGVFRFVSRLFLLSSRLMYVGLPTVCSSSDITRQVNLMVCSAALLTRPCILGHQYVSGRRRCDLSLVHVLLLASPLLWNLHVEVVLLMELIWMAFGMPEHTECGQTPSCPTVQLTEKMAIF